MSAADRADVLWFLPTHGDGRYLGTDAGARHVTMGYISQIARAADDQGISVSQYVREAALIRAVLDELDSAEDALHTAHDLLAIVLGYNFSARLLRDPAATGRAHDAFDRLLDHIRS